MEHRSLLSSLVYPLIWGRIPSAAAAEEVLKAVLVAPEALAAAALEPLPLEVQPRMDLAVVAAAAVALLPQAESAEPAAWRFNMPTTAMWPPET